MGDTAARIDRKNIVLRRKKHDAVSGDGRLPSFAKGPIDIVDRVAPQDRAVGLKDKVAAVCADVRILAVDWSARRALEGDLLPSAIEHVDINGVVGVGIGKRRMREKRDVTAVRADRSRRAIEPCPVGIFLIDGEHPAHDQRGDLCLHGDPRISPATLRPIRVARTVSNIPTGPDCA